MPRWCSRRAAAPWRSSRPRRCRPPAAPTPAQLAAFYTGHTAAFTLPERRAFRYAFIDRGKIAAGIAISDADVRKYYAANAATYAGAETRKLLQIVVPDQAKAATVVAAVKGGKSFAAAAAAAGFAATDIDIGEQTKAKFADATSPTVADAAFVLRVGGTTAPVQSPFGWHVVSVTGITPARTRTLDAARAEIAAKLKDDRVAALLSDTVGKVEDALSGRTSLAEVAKRFDLTVAAVPGVTRAGTDPADPGFVLAPAAAPLVAKAFEADPADGPTLQQFGKDAFAVLELGDITPPAAQPLAKVHDAVLAAYVADARMTAAKLVADTIVAETAKNRPFASVVAAHNLPPARPLSGRRIDLSQATQNPPPVKLFQTMPAGASRALPAGLQGYWVVHVDTVTPGRHRHVAAAGRQRPRAVHQGCPRRDRRRLRRGGRAHGRRQAQRDRPCRGNCADHRRREIVPAVSPAPAAFTAALAAGRGQMVWIRIVADTETPVSAMLKLGTPGSGAFLLESVEGGAVRGRYSLLGLDPDLVWRATGDGCEVNRDWQRDRTAFVACPSDTLSELRALVASCRMEVPSGLPPALATLVGTMGYDSARLAERLPEPKVDPLGIPDLLFVRPTLVLVFDRLKDELFFVAPVYPGAAPDAYARAVEAIETAQAKLARPVPVTATPSVDLPDGSMTPVLAAGRYETMVRAAQELIAAGDIFQVVLAQRFTIDFPLPPFDLYRALRRINPSPFLYFLDLPGFALIGSSPEILVRVRDGEVTIRPIAGTRPRGRDAVDDARLRDELLADPKELAEHLMLLDLGRNDVGRVATGGSVVVTDRFGVEFYSHVMHIVSNVRGTLDPCPRRDRRAARRFPRRHRQRRPQGPRNGSDPRSRSRKARAVRRRRRLFLARRQHGQLHRAPHCDGQRRRHARPGRCRCRLRFDTGKRRCRVPSQGGCPVRRRSRGAGARRRCRVRAVVFRRSG